MAVVVEAAALGVGRVVRYARRWGTLGRRTTLEVGVDVRDRRERERVRDWEEEMLGVGSEQRRRRVFCWMRWGISDVKEEVWWRMSGWEDDICDVGGVWL